MSLLNILTVSLQKSTHIKKFNAVTSTFHYSTAVNNNDTKDIFANISLGIEEEVNNSDISKDSPELNLTLQSIVANKINGTSDISHCRANHVSDKK